MAETGTRNEFTRATHDRSNEAGALYALEAGKMTSCKVIEGDAGSRFALPGIGCRRWD